MDVKNLYIKNNDEEIMNKVLSITLPRTSDTGNPSLYGKGNNIKLNPKDSLYEQCLDALDNILTNFQEFCSELEKANLKFFIFGDSESEHPCTIRYMGCNDGLMNYTSDEGFFDIDPADGVFSKYKLSDETKEVLRSSYDKIVDNLEDDRFDFLDVSSFPPASQHATYLNDNTSEDIIFSDDENNAFAEYCKKVEE